MFENIKKKIAVPRIRISLFIPVQLKEWLNQNNISPSLLFYSACENIGYPKNYTKNNIEKK